FFLVHGQDLTVRHINEPVTAPSQAASVEITSIEPLTQKPATPSTASTTPKKASKKVSVEKSTPPSSTQQDSIDQATRTENPSPFPPKSFPEVNAAPRSALVNILCMPQSGALQPISGSGVFIDPRGVILTNAHVAQYVLLSESAQINLNCMIRTG